MGVDSVEFVRAPFFAEDNTNGRVTAVIYDLKAGQRKVVGEGSQSFEVDVDGMLSRFHKLESILDGSILVILPSHLVITSCDERFANVCFGHHFLFSKGGIYVSFDYDETSGISKSLLVYGIEIEVSVSKRWILINKVGGQDREEYSWVRITQGARQEDFLRAVDMLKLSTSGSAYFGAQEEYHGYLRRAVEYQVSKLSTSER